MDNFDQWTEALSKQILVQSDEKEMKVLLRECDTYNDDFNEEE